MNTHTLPNRLLLPAVCLLLGMACAVVAADKANSEAERGPGVSLTIYNQNFAIVKQRRSMTLPQKAGEVKTDVDHISTAAVSPPPPPPPRAQPPRQPA